MRGVVAQKSLGLLQNILHLLAAYVGELLKEITDRATTGQGIKQ